MGRDIAVAIATGCGLDGRFGGRIAVGARFSAPVQTVPVSHPAPYAMGTGVKQPGHDVNHPPPSCAEV